MKKSEKPTKKTTEKKTNKIDVATKPKKVEDATIKKQTCRYDDIIFDDDHIDISAWSDKSSQPLCYINQKDDSKVAVQTSDFIHITSHGIPRLDKDSKDSKKKFYPTDSKRMFIKVPLDPKQPECDKLRAFCVRADEYFGSAKVRKQLFGQHAKNYEYAPCTRTPRPVLNKDADKKKSDKPKPIIDYVKFVFHMKKVSDDDYVNQMKITKIEGKKKISIKAVTVTDIAKEITYLSKIKYVFYIHKLWANEAPLSGSNKILYGVGFKIIVINYIPSTNKRGLNIDEIDVSMPDDMESEAEEDPGTKPSKKKFDDDDDDAGSDDDGNDKKTKKSAADVDDKKKKAKKADSDDDDDDDDKEPKVDSDGDDDEDDDDKKKQTKKAKKADSDDEDDDTDKKKQTKKAKKGDSDDDEDDTNKKKQTKNAKKADSGDDDDADGDIDLNVDDDDDESDNKNKKTKNVDTEEEIKDSGEEDDDVNITLGNKQKAAKKKAVVKDSDDEDDDGEEIKPTKKPKKKAASRSK